MLKASKRKYLCLLAMIVLSVLWGILSKKDIQLHKSLKSSSKPHWVFEEEYIKTVPSPPFTGKGFIGFKEALAFQESRGNYKIIGKFGHIGKYQFSKHTLRALGVNDTTLFLESAIQQEEIFKKSILYHKKLLKHEIETYNGKYIDGILISEAGILAAAHLAGAKNIKRFLQSKGSINSADNNGTSIKKYMKFFSEFIISDI